jgi:hypothetical protein
MDDGWKKQQLTEIETPSEQNSDFTGARKWFLLYKPEGIKAWIAHSLYYFCALVAIVLKVKGIIAIVEAVHGSSAWLPAIYFTTASLFVLLTIRLRAFSLRISRSSNPRRQ